MCCLVSTHLGFFRTYYSVPPSTDIDQLPFVLTLLFCQPHSVTGEGARELACPHGSYDLYKNFKRKGWHARKTTGRSLLSHCSVARCQINAGDRICALSCDRQERVVHLKSSVSGY